MKRIALIAASSAVVLTSSLAFAQPQPVPPAGSGDRGQRYEQGDRDQRGGDWRERRTERMQQRMDERFARLRDDMKLKPEQVPLFDRIKQVVKKNAEERRQRWASMRDQRETFRHADIMERLDMTAGRQADRAGRSKELADAVRPLWTTLSDEQKTVARRAVREAMAEGRQRMERMREHRHDRRGWREDDRRDDRGQGRWRNDRNDRDDDDRG